MPTRLPLAEHRLLCGVARFGFLTATQGTALTGYSPGEVRRALGALLRRGLLSAADPRWERGPHRVYALTGRGRARLRVAGGPPAARINLDRLDEILAATDLALALEAQGVGNWLTWAECLRATPGLVPVPARAGRTVPPAGVLREPDGGLCPVWVLLRRRPLRRLRRELQVYLQPPLGWGEIHAPPELVPSLAGGLLPATVRPWRPPHLWGRPPLLPGWWRGAGTHPRLRAGAVTALHQLDRFGHLAARQLARDAGLAPRTARALLGRLEARGLAQRGGGRPCAWSATAAGLAAIGSRREPVAQQPAHRRHTLALCDLAHQLAAETGGTWETERELRSGDLRPGGRRPPPPPDGRLRLPDGRRICLQLQLSRGEPRRQLREAHSLVARGLCAEVWFCCTPAVIPSYRRALRPGDAGLIQVREWPPPAGG